MRTRYSYHILTWACLTGLAVQAQEPLIPLWSHVDPFGAGSSFISPDVLSTRISYDHGTDRIYRSIIGTWDGYKIQVFDPEGTDLTPSPPVELHGIPPGDYQVNQIVQLSATNDTLSAIVHGEVSGTDDLNWLKVLGTDGSPYYLLGTGPTALNDFHRDAIGTLVLTDDELRRYGPSGWPEANIAVSNAESMAVLGDVVVLGVPPLISRIDRNAMTALAPIAVPGLGSASSGVCLANGSSTFNFAALNGNGLMILGLADINSGPIWSTTISIPAQAQPTAYHVDEQGDFWIAVAHNATDIATLGLLYRFDYSGGPYGVNSFSRRIDGIASSGGRLFLTGRQAGSTSDTYLAAFDTDLITSIECEGAVQISLLPNPASDLLNIRSIAQGTKRVQLMDATGRSLKELTGPFGTTLNFSVADLAPGSYFVRIEGLAGSATLPFQVSR